MTMDTRRRVAVLISGRGSNLAALVAAAKRADYPAELALVVASGEDAAGLGHARDAGIPTAVVVPGKRAQRAEAEAVLETALAAHKIDLICLAGYMFILSADFVTRWRDRLINI
ncbi:MAG: phosphoribosylglycinamide formyltransferase, partial [Alphaproteobacteria bacterium]